MKYLFYKTVTLIFSFVLPGLLFATESIHNEFNIVFMKIPAGEFIMGSKDLDEIVIEQPDGNAAMVKDETPAHRVVFKNPFYLGKTEITQSQWLAVMDSKIGPDSHWSRKDWKDLPAVSISWHDTQAFIQKLNAQDKQYRYRLPTEAEWEYASRAGSTGMRPYPFEELIDNAWYIENSTDIVQPVATRKANTWGLHDMFGNAWEWINDWYAPDYYANSPAISPTGPLKGTKRMRRGGSYHCPIHLVRPGYRSADNPDTAYSVLGFRLVAETL